ncbi:hypothetical protein JZ751_000325 [Albula glossodonta]|uniref:Uncharacterized protein n=1 Tax=Albula glossodonta TaxID=121402 RepID=A0A8T2PVJ9_9TELE|nr:hypothetical protein JZ751_000325 [Albula glossodonta]
MRQLLGREGHNERQMRRPRRLNVHQDGRWKKRMTLQSELSVTNCAPGHGAQSKGGFHNIKCMNSGLSANDQCQYPWGYSL